MWIYSDQRKDRNLWHVEILHRLQLDKGKQHNTASTAARTGSTKTFTYSIIAGKNVEHLRVRCWSKARLLLGSDDFPNLKSHIFFFYIYISAWREGVVALLWSSRKLRRREGIRSFTPSNRLRHQDTRRCRMQIPPPPTLRVSPKDVPRTLLGCCNIL